MKRQSRFPEKSVSLLPLALLKKWGGDVEQEKTTGGTDPETARPGGNPNAGTVRHTSEYR